MVFQASEDAKAFAEELERREKTFAARLAEREAALAARHAAAAVAAGATAAALAGEVEKAERRLANLAAELERARVEAEVRGGGLPARFTSLTHHGLKAQRLVFFSLLNALEPPHKSTREVT